MQQPARLAARSFGGRPLADHVAGFEADGVAMIPGGLTHAELGLVQRAFDWKLANPGPWGSNVYADSGARFFQAKGDSSAQPAFHEMLSRTPIADYAAMLFGGGPVWYFEEQLFYKEGATDADGVRRTPWHQDVSYQPMTGAKSVVFWIALDPVPRDCALEVVRGSHRGLIYNASKFDPADDTAPFFDNALPRLPDVEAHRENWGIAGWAIAPGDLLVFHGASLHGGGGTMPGGRRRSLTLRFIGDDVMKLELPRTVGMMQARGEEAASIKRPPSAMDRYWALPPGAPVHTACSSQVRA